MGETTTVRTLSIQLPLQKAQLDFNERRWDELLADRALRRIEGRIETDRHGRIIMTPPAGAQHAGLQSQIAYLLHEQMPHGRVLTECPISTADGVRAADVAWASSDRIRELGTQNLFPQAPEVCVEVRSPDDTDAALREKAALYFDADAREVWICSQEGAMTFYRAGDSSPLQKSGIFPDFPSKIELST